MDCTPVKKSVFLICLILTVLPVSAQQQVVINAGNEQYLSGEIIVRLKQVPQVDAAGNAYLSQELTEQLKNLSVTGVRQIFTSQPTDAPDMQSIVSVFFSSPVDPRFAASKVSKVRGVLWAEPRFVYLPSYVPNDPRLNEQWALQKIQAQQAWDITKGDTSIVIGIVDTGVDWDHPDLDVNMKYNLLEDPYNGIDDDHNGYVDDYVGWDFGGLTGTPDNNPMEDQPDHGTHVAGCAAATTDNGIGVAAIGFRSRILAVKTSRNDNRDPGTGMPYILYGFEGIKYAADNGAKVINCSWGGGGYSIFGAEICVYATGRGALVVAAAGNNNQLGTFYPSDYPMVLGVASTTSSDLKSGFSNYGYGVDVSAPGSSILATWQNDAYASLSGTSMASPIVAGLAGLVFARFPQYTPMQVGEQIRATTDNIYNVNPSYVDMLGKGRINAFQAVNNTTAISVRALTFTPTDIGTGNGNGILEPNEVVTLPVSFVNYLAAITGVTVTLTAMSADAVVQNGTFVSGAVASNTPFSTLATPFTFKVGANVAVNQKVMMKLTYSGTGYSDVQYFEIVLNATFTTQSGNDVAMTITGRGNFGYNDYPNNTQGDGFKFNNGASLTYEGSLMIGTDAVKLADAARQANQNLKNNDFNTVTPFLISIPGADADIQGYGVINDDAAGVNKVGITAALNSYSFTSEGNRKFILLKYLLTNTSGAPLQNLRVGLFFDWDLSNNGATDIGGYDATYNFAYVRTNSGSPAYHTGIAPIGPSSTSFLIKNDGGDTGFSIYDGFTKTEKWRSMTESKVTAGPGDVSMVVAVGPFSVAAGDTVQFGFVVGAGDDFTDLQNSMYRGRLKYEEVTSVSNGLPEVPQEFALDQNYPNPFNPETVIRFSIRETGFVSLKVYDLLGAEVATLVDSPLSVGQHQISFNATGIPSGVYFYSLTSGGQKLTRKLMVLK